MMHLCNDVILKIGHGVQGHADQPIPNDITGALPTRLGNDSVGLPTGAFSAIKFMNTVLKELNKPTNLDGYNADNQFEIENAESAIGTAYSDVIIGADEVYTLKTPAADPNAAPGTPAPQPQWTLDTNFAGYDLIGNGGNDTILVYNGHADQVTYHLIDGGAGDDVIVVRDFGDQFTIDAVTGKETRSEIRGGDGNDVIFSIGAGIGGEVVGGAGRDFLLNTAFKGKVWGDSKGGDVTEGQDIFWYFPGVFLMDASAQDRLQMFGIPLTGGTKIPCSIGDIVNLMIVDAYGFQVRVANDNVLLLAKRLA